MSFHRLSSLKHLGVSPHNYNKKVLCGSNADFDGSRIRVLRGLEASIYRMRTVGPQRADFPPV